MYKLTNNVYKLTPKTIRELPCDKALEYTSETLRIENKWFIESVEVLINANSLHREMYKVCPKCIS